MPTKWFKRFRETGQLTVYDRAGSWSPALKKAMATFNSLGFGVKVVEEKNERDANIVVKLAKNGETYPYPSRKNILKADFPTDKLHGNTQAVAHPRRLEIEFAVVFLPGETAEGSMRQKEVIIVHELLHAAGLSGSFVNGVHDNKSDHEDVGIMCAQFVNKGDGAVEMGAPKDTPAMTPIRVGPQTMCKIRSLWVAGESCKTD